MPAEKTGWCGSTAKHDEHWYTDQNTGETWRFPGYTPVKR